ncbi:MAG: UDP-N-acetylmuramate dehydrogenase [Prevotella sp.]|nr:UDP-N-acetylmuramate dehydrogenase [Prevotella sp.]
MRDIRNYNLLSHNTFGITVSCSRFLEYSSTVEAVSVASILRGAQQPYMMIGAGSNLLLTHDYEGIVVHSAIKGMSTVETPLEEATIVNSGSGECWDDLVAWTVNMGYGDLVNLSLIPGDVGASAVQNIGAYGAEAGMFVYQIKAVEIATGQLTTIPAAACHYGYRDSLFKHEWRNKYLITHVSYCLKKNARMNLNYGNITTELARKGISTPTPQQLRDVIIDIRHAKLPEPKELGNAGSFFMNPIVSREKFEELATRYPQMPHYRINDQEEKIPAGWLIDQCGWKGRRMGRAAVYEKQALVLVNLGGATGNDIVVLCKAIQDDVRRTFGIDLKPEVNII